MKKRLLILTVLISVCTLTFAQDENTKFSITTQMFLQEMKGEVELDITPQRKAREKQLNLHPVANESMRRYDRLITSPDTISGEAFISCFIHLNNAAETRELEAKGIQIQETFDNGIITALIPVDKITEVAEIENVKKIKVAQKMRPTTNAARQATNVDDLLTQSTDAISAGLTKTYDGTGVILGVIDTGIDFNHIAFKDKDGNSRIKRAYVYNGSSAQEYTSITSTTLTDDKSEDHGTHTSSIAGGSSVTVSGNNVTVTDNHANATYGGMAPGADLYLAGINGLSDTYLSNALSKMVTYADAQGKPLVVSNSWGSQLGPHDGTGEWADIVAQYFGNNHPNRIILFASSNDAGTGAANDGGGYHVSGTASSSNPLRSILRCHYYSDTNDGYYYAGPLVNAWARSTSVSTIQCKIYVLNASTGAVLASTTVTPTTNGASVSGLSSYYSGTLYAYKDYIEGSNKTQILLYSSGLTTRSASNYNSNYTLAVELYPSSGTSIIDAWGGNYCYFTNYLTTSGYNWTNGSDDMSVSDEATIPNAISVGAYVTKTDWRSASGTNHSASDEYTIGDIAGFSSYATAAKSPDGIQYPWITAPGARIASAVNHNHTSSVDNYSYYGSYFIDDLVVNSSTNPYAMMEGTSMATPAAAGIVALWLQASLEPSALHNNLTVNDVKTIMQETAIKDAFTNTGANASHFGNGKIDALAGVQYILGATAGPVIKATPTSVDFGEANYATKTYTQTINIKGLNLDGGITVTLNDQSGSFSCNTIGIPITAADAGVNAIITYAPTAAGTHTATLTLTSPNAESVTVLITGTAKPADPELIADPETLTFSTGLSESQSLTFDVLSNEFLKGDVTVTLTDANNVFTISPTTITKAQAEDGATVTVTFNSATEGTFTGIVTLTAQDCDPVTISLSAEAADGGSASDAYLNIAKYATIDEAGWNTSLVNNLYKYTEYESEEVAWLTLPMYGALVGAKYSATSTTFNSGSPQKWIATSVTQTNQIGSTTWSASDVLLGSNNYFTSTTAKVVGTNSTSSRTAKTVTFYVTNTTAIKLYCNQATTSSSYPTTLTIYECTVNSDGTLTEGTTSVKSGSLTTSGANTISLTGLNKSTVYKVVASQARGYLYEIGFQTPLQVVKTPKLAVNPTSLSMTANVGKTETKTVAVTGVNLTANISAAISGTNANMFSVSPANLTTTGGTLNVTYAPTATGNHSATLTLSSTGAENVTVSLNGTATEPDLIVDPESLTFSTYAGNSVTSTFDVLGENLNGAVTLTLNDANNVFSLNTSSITKEQAEEGKTVTVTFTPTAATSYSATVTISTEGVADQTVTLNGSSTASSVNVTVSNYGITTLYAAIPLEIPYDTYDDLLGVYYAYEFNQVDKDVRLRRIKNYIPAETGVIIQANKGSYTFPIAKTAVDDITGNMLQGSLVAIPTSSIDGTVLTLGMGSNGYIGFYKYVGSTLAANKAFLVLPDSEVKSLNIVIDNSDGTPTSISKVGDNADQRDEWYTLQGVRLNGRPVGKGIYIHNGQRELLK